MSKSKGPKLSCAQITALRDALQHGDPCHSATGRSQRGGLTATIYALRRRGLLFSCDNTITPEGKAALEAATR